MTGNIPSYLHTQSSLPNSGEEREGPREKRRETGRVEAVDWKRWRQSETKTDSDGNRKMKHTQRDEMSMLIQLYHNHVLRNNDHVYIMPVILHQQLQYIHYLSALLFVKSLPARIRVAFICDFICNLLIIKYSLKQTATQSNSPLATCDYFLVGHQV